MLTASLVMMYQFDTVDCAKWFIPFVQSHFNVTTCIWNAGHCKIAWLTQIIRKLLFSYKNKLQFCSQPIPQSLLRERAYCDMHMYFGITTLCYDWYDTLSKCYLMWIGLFCYRVLVYIHAHRFMSHIHTRFPRNKPRISITWCLM